MWVTEPWANFGPTPNPKSTQNEQLSKNKHKRENGAKGRRFS